MMDLRGWRKLQKTRYSLQGDDSGGAHVGVYNDEPGRGVFGPHCGNALRSPRYEALGGHREDTAVPDRNEG